MSGKPRFHDAYLDEVVHQCHFIKRGPLYWSPTLLRPASCAKKVLDDRPDRPPPARTPREEQRTEKRTVHNRKGEDKEMVVVDHMFIPHCTDDFDFNIKDFACFRCRTMGRQGLRRQWSRKREQSEITTPLPVPTLLQFDSVQQTTRSRRPRLKEQVPPRPAGAKTWRSFRCLPRDTVL